MLTVVDKATKMVYFVPCTKSITGKETAQLFWSIVGCIHGIPSVIISDRDVRFTGSFWRELWRILGTGLRMGTAYHPQSSGQVERYNQVLSQLLRCTIHQVGDGAHWTNDHTYSTVRGEYNTKSFYRLHSVLPEFWTTSNDTSTVIRSNPDQIEDRISFDIFAVTQRPFCEGSGQHEDCS